MPLPFPCFLSGSNTHGRPHRPSTLSPPTHGAACTWCPCSLLSSSTTYHPMVEPAAVAVGASASPSEADLLRTASDDVLSHARMSSGALTRVELRALCARLYGRVDFLTRLQDQVRADMYRAMDQQAALPLSSARTRALPQSSARAHALPLSRAHTLPLSSARALALPQSSARALALPQSSAQALALPTRSLDLPLSSAQSFDLPLSSVYARVGS